MRRESISRREWITGRNVWLTIWLPVLAITFGHYATGSAHTWIHDVFRRLYYIPIVLGAFRFGVRGALAASVAASLLYLPHGFTHFFHHDPAHGLEKILEILLYNVVAVITGVLADREFRERRRQEDTARRLAETLDEMKLMERQLIRTERLHALGELTAGLAHEIKNPLASLKGATDIISDEIPADSPRRRMVEILRKELDRLQTLLDRFLTFAKPESIQVADVCVCDVIEPTLVLLQAQTRDAGVSVTWARCQDRIVVRGDAAKISQVLLNLALNAVQATPPGGRIMVHCGYETRGRHRYGSFAVEDSGPGVGDALREKIFNPFFTTKESGTGLGLSIAARIVDEHDGMIEVENRPEGGAVFRVLLPAA